MHILRFVLAAAGLWFGIRSFRAARDRPRKVRAVLGFLSDGAWHDGLRVLRACDGQEIPSADSYVLLADMEEEGLVEARVEARPDGSDGPRTRYYRIGMLGRRHLAEHPGDSRAAPSADPLAA